MFKKIAFGVFLGIVLFFGFVFGYGIVYARGIRLIIIASPASHGRTHSILPSSFVILGSREEMFTIIPAIKKKFRRLVPSKTRSIFSWHD